MPTNSSSIAATSIDALGNWLIELKLKKNLGPEIVKMDPEHTEHLHLLMADIGDVDMNVNNPVDGTGIRQVVWITYNLRIVTQNQYILHNQCTVEEPAIV